MEAGHSSTAISIASGMALARDLNKENYNIVAVVGDASIVSGLEIVSDTEPPYQQDGFFWAQPYN